TPAPTPAPTPVVASVRVSPDNQRIGTGDRLTLSVQALDASGRVIAGSHTVAWTTSNPFVAVVTSSGTVIGLLQGDASITATIAGKSGSVRVRVRRDDD
ncbi:MAG: Ig-like domain-containing protein, partial [Gemmatirosa sp.]